MPIRRAQCTCWRLPLTDGGDRPTAWASLQQRIRVHRADGWSAEGVGFVAVSNQTGAPVEVFAVRQDDGRVAWCEPDAIAAVEIPVGLDRSAALRAVADAFQRPLLIPSDGLQLGVVVGDHEQVKINITLEQASCQPGAGAGSPPRGINLPARDR